MTTTEISTLSRATGMLILVTMLWGMAFVLMKDWQEAAARESGERPMLHIALVSCTLIAVRMTIALVLLAITRPRAVFGPTRQEHTFGAIIGVVFFLGFLLQTIGLAWTSPALSAFITSLCSAWVPLLAWFGGIRVGRLTGLGLALALSGTAILTIGQQSHWSLGSGEILTLVSSVIFAFQILMLDRWGRRSRSSHLTAAFMATAALLAWLCNLLLLCIGSAWTEWWDWINDTGSRPSLLLDLLALTVFSTFLAFHWMNVYQPRVPASRAALIYLLEPLFGSAFSVAAGYDLLSLRLIFGGSFILAGNLLVEARGLFKDDKNND
jgi:drug/metabolite transporter (DMT)-like permease